MPARVDPSLHKTPNHTGPREARDWVKPYSGKYWTRDHKTSWQISYCCGMKLQADTTITGTVTVWCPKCGRTK